MLLFDFSVNRKWRHGVSATECPADRVGVPYGNGTRYSASGSFKYRARCGYPEMLEAARRVLQTVHTVGESTPRGEMSI